MAASDYVPHLARSYDAAAAKYRADDEIEIATENHRRIAGRLRELCRSFSRPIRVLEIGCGTGRYFYCLENVERLVGADVSAEMLRHAEHPVREFEVSAKSIQLLHADVYAMDFPDESFDLIYSLGVFGYGARVSDELAGKLNRWLAPGGRLFFDAIEVPPPGTPMERVRYRVKCALQPWLPRALRRFVEKREVVPLLTHSQAELSATLGRSGFTKITLTSEKCLSSLWEGVHVECVAQKSPASGLALAAAVASVTTREA